jgi:hypothetical protein
LLRRCNQLHKMSLETIEMIQWAGGGLARKSELVKQDARPAVQKNELSSLTSRAEARKEEARGKDGRWAAISGQGGNLSPRAMNALRANDGARGGKTVGRLSPKAMNALRANDVKKGETDAQPKFCGSFASSSMVSPNPTPRHQTVQGLPVRTMPVPVQKMPDLKRPKRFTGAQAAPMNAAAISASLTAANS